jgi:MFS family permease
MDQRTFSSGTENSHCGRCSSHGVFYGWKVVGVAFITMAMAFGIWYSFSVFLIAITEEFEWSRSATSGVFSLFLMVYSGMSIVIGSLLDRFGPRVVLPCGGLLVMLGLLATSQIRNLTQFYLYYGLLTAVGVCALGHISHSIFLADWFIKKRGLAFGIAMSGIGLGLMGVAPLAQYSISHFGWRTAYCILAAIVFIILIPLNLIYHRKNPAALNLYPDGECGLPHPTESLNSTAPKASKQKVQAGTSTFKNSVFTIRFWLFFAGYFFAAFAIQGALLHQFAYIVGQGVSAENAAFLLGVVGLMGSAGKILLGYISDKTGRERPFFISLFCAFLAILLLLAFKWGGYAVLCGYAVLFGIGYGSIPQLLAVSAADLFQGPHFGKIFGFLSIAIGLGGASGAWVNGKIFDLTNSYSLAFSITNCSFILVGIIFWFSYRRYAMVRS